MMTKTMTTMGQMFTHASVCVPQETVVLFSANVRFSFIKLLVYMCVKKA